MDTFDSTQLRISAVSYLNTTPLVWGLTNGPLTGRAALSFELPSACADAVREGRADVGIIPVIEMARMGLPSAPGLGIASDGPVRSIFLISKMPAGQIGTLALDTSSRTSVELARVILEEKYSNRPRTVRHAPDVEQMLQAADAALVIGDPALRLSPEQPGYYVYDLGAEWTGMTGLPMVYAMWAGRRAAEAAELLRESYSFGRERIDEIAQREAGPRGVTVELAREYLTRHIVFELGERHRLGLEMYLKLALAGQPVGV